MCEHVGLEIVCLRHHHKVTSVLTITSIDFVCSSTLCVTNTFRKWYTIQPLYTFCVYVIYLYCVSCNYVICNIANCNLSWLLCEVETHIVPLFCYVHSRLYVIAQVWAKWNNGVKSTPFCRRSKSHWFQTYIAYWR